MATKDLARTVIEPGRTASSQVGRRRLRRRERREGRAFCAAARRAGEEGRWDLPSAPRGLPQDGSLTQGDKLGPLERWLRSRCGRPWDDVYAELAPLRRSGNIAVSHVVDVHLLPWVSFPGEAHGRWPTPFAVDDEGVLRERPRGPRRRGGDRTWGEVRAARAWAGLRRVLRRGDRLYWTAPTEVEVRDPAGGVRVVALHHRQGAALNPAERARFLALSRAAQDALLHPPPVA